MTSQDRFKRSLFDRLFAVDAERSNGIVLTYSLEQLRDAVARDVEALLNSRSIFDFDDMLQFPNARDSVACFGIRDFVGKSLKNSAEQREISRSLAVAIETHEPRLRNVQIQFHAGDEMDSGALLFSIKALMVTYPSLEPVSFDAVLQPSLSRFELKGSNKMYSPALPAETSKMNNKEK